MAKYTAEEIEKFKKRTENYRKFAITAQELYDKLGEFIKQGHGDAMFDVSDNCGGSYVLGRDDMYLCEANKDVENSAEVFGKWIVLGECQ